MSARSFRALLIAGDVAVFVITVVLMGRSPVGPLVTGMGAAILGLSQFLALYLVEAYEERVYREVAGVPTRVLVSGLIAAGLVGLAALVYPAAGLTRPLAGVYFLVGIPLLIAWRGGGSRLVRSRLRPLRVAVVGDGDAARELGDAFEEHPNYVLVAIVGSRPRDFYGVGEGGPEVCALPEDLAGFLDERGVEVAAVAAPRDGRDALFRQLVACRYRGIEVRDVASSFELLLRRLPVRYLEDDWVAFSSRFVGWGHDLEERGKRLMDVTVALFGILVTGPLMLLLAGAIRLTSPGPALLRQTRVGEGGRSFTLHKFRSMRADAEQNGAVWALENDPRITWVGAILRRSHLDELPQLFNVLAGDMSLVGPRPERPEFVAELRTRVPYYDLRHIVKPGVTGWAQISYSYGSSIEDATVKLEYDLYYIRHKDLLWDLRIILRTVPVSLLARGSR